MNTQAPTVKSSAFLTLKEMASKLEEERKRICEQQMKLKARRDELEALLLGLQVAIDPENFTVQMKQIKDYS